LLKQNTDIDIANNLILQRLLRLYLSEPDRDFLTIEDACVTACRIGNRSGIPRDATTWRVQIEHPDQGWTIVARGVWRNGDLMKPWATHVVIEQYFDDNDSLGGPDAVRLLAHDWLRSLPL